MSASISIPGYPDSNLVPGTYFVVKPNGGASVANQRALIIAPMLATGTATPNLAQISAGPADAQTKYGVRSIAAQMVQDYQNQDSFGEIWVGAVAQPGSGTAGSGTITLAGTATASGTLFPYIAGQRVPVSVTLGDTPTVMAANLAAAITAQTAFPVTASATAGVVTLTAVDITAAGADIDVRMNYQGTIAGEATPPGVTVTIGAFSAGTTNPTLTTLLGNLGTTTFDAIICAFNDSTSRAAIAAFLNDIAGRWSWTEELFGHAFYASRGTLGVLTALGVTNNDQHQSILGVYDTPWPMYRVAADVAGAAFASLKADPGQPLNTLPLNMPAPPLASRFTLGQQNSLLYDGIGTINVNDAGQVSISRLPTTWQFNAAGAPDATYRNTERLYQAMFAIRDARAFLETTYTRKKIAADGSRIAAGSNVTTAQLILAGMLARYQTYCTIGLCQDYATFAAGAAAQNAGGGLVKLLLPFQFADQLEVIAALALIAAG